MLHRIQKLTIRFLILTLIGTVAAKAFSMPQQQQQPPPSKTIYGVPNSGWTSPEWNWGYAAGTGHDCAAICRRKYASSEERSRLIGDLLLGPESSNSSSNSSNNNKPDLEEVKLVLALKWQRNYRSGYGDVLDAMADAVRYESERGNELLLRDMMERFHLLDPVEEDRLAMEGLADNTNDTNKDEIDTDGALRRCSGLVLKAMGFADGW